MFTKDDWFVGEAQTDDGPLLIRARSELPSEADRKRYHELVTITWTYDGNDAGMPNTEDQERMSRFEGALEAGLEADKTGVQAVTLTGLGKREWRYYTADSERFLEALNRDLAEHEEYPLELELYEDEAWNALVEMLVLRSGADQ